MSERFLTTDWMVKAANESVDRYFRSLAAFQWLDTRVTTVNWRAPGHRFVSPSRELLDAAEGKILFDGGQWSQSVIAQRQQDKKYLAEIAADRLAAASRKYTRKTRKSKSLKAKAS